MAIPSASSLKFTYRPVVDELLTEAWERCGKNPEILNGSVAASARRSMQLMLLDYAARGLNLWQVERVAISTVYGVPTITLDPSTIDVVSVHIMNSDGDELMVSPIPREAYLGMPRKDTPGQPNIYWPERSLPPVLHLFPTPDDIYTLSVWRIRQPADITGLVQTPDTPVLWSEALASGLASRLAMKFVDDPQKRAELRSDAEHAFATASSESRERTPFTLLPDFGYY